jgi:hypothetical protein
MWLVAVLMLLVNNINLELGLKLYQQRLIVVEMPVVYPVLNTNILLAAFVLPEQLDITIAALVNATPRL